jgi:hypothetical protein
MLAKCGHFFMLALVHGALWGWRQKRASWADTRGGGSRAAALVCCLRRRVHSSRRVLLFPCYLQERDPSGRDFAQMVPSSFCPARKNLFGSTASPRTRVS